MLCHRPQAGNKSSNKAEDWGDVGLLDLPGPGYAVHREVWPARLELLQPGEAELVRVRQEVDPGCEDPPVQARHQF